MAFRFMRLSIPDVVCIEPDRYQDDRGSFFELYKHPEFEEFGLHIPFVQFNLSSSRRDVIRGLHYQLNPAAQAKLVMVMSGTIFDVIVDIRKNSPWYGQWVGVEMTSAKKSMVYVPEGFAHGFCAVTDTAEALYCCSQVYMPRYEAGVAWNDPDLAVTWPSVRPVLSDKDRRHPCLKDAANNFVYDPGKPAGLSHDG